MSFQMPLSALMFIISGFAGKYGWNIIEPFEWSIPPSTESTELEVVRGGGGGGGLLVVGMLVSSWWRRQAGGIVEGSFHTVVAGFLTSDLIFRIWNDATVWGISCVCVSWIVIHNTQGRPSQPPPHTLNPEPPSHLHHSVFDGCVRYESSSTFKCPDPFSNQVC